MKTKELLQYLDTNNLAYLTKLKELELSELKLKEVFNYYDGNLDGIVEIDNNNYYYTFIDKDKQNNRIFIVINTNNYKFNNWQELFSRDLDILGYFIN